MAILHRRVPLATDSARRGVEVVQPGRGIYVLSSPSALNLKIRVGSRDADPIDLSTHAGFVLEEGEGPFSSFFVTHDAVPGGELVLAVVSGLRLEASGGAGDVSIGTVAQGDAGPQAWGVSEAELRVRVGATTDAETTGNGSVIAILKRLRTIFGAPTDAEAAGDGSVVAILKRLRTLLGGVATSASSTASAWGLFGFEAANPAPVDQALTGGADVVDVAAVLGRVGYRGYVAGHQDNAGDVTVESSFDGATWVQLGVLPAGAGLSLEGVAVDSLRLTGTAGDRVLGEVH